MRSPPYSFPIHSDSVTNNPQSSSRFPSSLSAKTDVSLLALDVSAFLNVLDQFPSESAAFFELASSLEESGKLLTSVQVRGMRVDEIRSIRKAPSLARINMYIFTCFIILFFTCYFLCSVFCRGQSTMNILNLYQKATKQGRITNLSSQSTDTLGPTEWQDKFCPHILSCSYLLCLISWTFERTWHGFIWTRKYRRSAQIRFVAPISFSKTFPLFPW